MRNPGLASRTQGGSLLITDDAQRGIPGWEVAYLAQEEKSRSSIGTLGVASQKMAALS